MGATPLEDLPEVKLRIVDLEAAVVDVQTGSGESQDRFGQISIDASLEQPKQKSAALAIAFTIR